MVSQGMAPFARIAKFSIAFPLFLVSCPTGHDCIIIQRVDPGVRQCRTGQHQETQFPLGRGSGRRRFRRLGLPRLASLLKLFLEPKQKIDFSICLWISQST